MKAKAKLRPVSAEEHRLLDLLPGRKFFHAPPDCTVTCICGRQVVYLLGPNFTRGMCAKHGVDY